MACQCLSHLAAVRHSVFDSTDNRIVYVTNFVTELIKIFQSSAMQNFVMKERSLYKEFVPIVLKIENNFQIRDLMKIGDNLMEGYLSELFKFTLQSYKMPSESIKFHASKLNHLW